MLFFRYAFVILYKMTALMMASKSGDQAMVDSLVAAGADLNLQSCFGMTPLMMVAESGHQAIAAGANTNMQNKGWHNGYTAAESRGHHGVAELLKTRCLNLSQDCLLLQLREIVMLCYRLYPLR